GRWTSDSQFRINALNRIRRQIVKVEVGLLVGAFPKAGQVRFVPNLEEPRSNLVLTIPLLDMPNEGVHQLLPGQRHWMRSISLPIENLIVGCFHRIRRKAEFHKWLNPALEQIVIKQVQLGPVVCGFTVLDTHRGKHVVENRVEANVAKAGFIDDRLELGLTVVAYECPRKVGTNR